MEESLVLYLVGVPLLGIAAQWLAWRLRMPAILLLLACGVVLGQFVDPDELLSQVTGGARENGPRLLFPAVSLAVAVILFEGGLTLSFQELKFGGQIVFRLVTLGAAVAWGLTAIAARTLRIEMGQALAIGGPPDQIVRQFAAPPGAFATATFIVGTMLNTGRCGGG